MAATSAALIAVATHALPFRPLSVLTSAASQALVLVVAAGCLAVACVLRRSAALWPHVLVAGTALLCSTVVIIALAKTPFGLNGLDADQSFRSASMTRFALTAAPVDFGYRGHGAFFPPLWFWTAGGIARLLGEEGWQAMKWAQIVTAFLVPLLALLFWRRVAGLGAGALATVLGVLAVPEPIKGDEWLALVVMLPWWLNAFAGVQAPDVRRWPAWAHGVVAGLLLSLYTAFFLPAAVATLGLAAWSIRRGTWRPLWRRWAVIVAVGLVVWGWVWVPAIYERITGPPFSASQFFWFGDTSPLPEPIEVTVPGLLALAGLLALSWGAHRYRALRMHAWFGLSVGIVTVAGVFLAAGGHPILVQKTYPLLRYVLCTAAGLAAYAVIRTALERWPQRRRQLLSSAAVLVTAVCVTLGLQYVLDAVRGPSLVTAYRTVSASPNRAGAAEVARAIGADHDQVVLSDRYDLFTLHGYWNFNQFTNSYAHPHARWNDRVALIRRVARAETAEDAHRLLTRNDLERVDAVVLTPSGSDAWLLRYRENVYPNGTRPETITFRRASFSDAKLFRITELRGTVIIRPR